jgi:uncharacterized membrane protein HdeD (DUF308 family)
MVVKFRLSRALILRCVCAFIPTLVQSTRLPSPRLKIGAEAEVPVQERNMSTSTTAGHTTQSTAAAGESIKANVTLVKNWWLIELRGALAVVFGVIAIALPVATILALLILFAAYMLVDSAFSFVAAYRAARSGGRWGLLTVQGLASLVACIIAVIWPGITMLLIGAWAIVTGCLLLAAAVGADNNYGRLWFGLSGAVSMLYGVLMVVAPLLGAIVPTWWLGAFALVFGILLLVVASRLRARRLDRPAALTSQPVT